MPNVFLLGLREEGIGMVHDFLHAIDRDVCFLHFARSELPSVPTKRTIHDGWKYENCLGEKNVR
jgi:hypothetical protein